MGSCCIFNSLSAKKPGLLDPLESDVLQELPYRQKLALSCFLATNNRDNQKIVEARSMIKKTKNRFRRFKHQNLAHYPDFFHTLDFALESAKLLAFAGIFVVIFYVI